MELTINHLRKTYPNGVHALKDVSLTIAPGMFGLLGPNGAGKSTLMRILATLQEADGGEVRLGGIDVLRDKEALRRTLGYLPQEFGLYPRVTASELLDHFALLKGVVNARERRDTVQSLLEQTNLWDARNQRLGGFSGGMRQRFGIAVALIGNPRLIIVDEPTAGLDPAERVRFLNLLSALGENAVVLLSTHIVEDVSDLCQRMAVIQGGRILLEGAPAEAVRALAGRVWRREVPREELPAFEQTHPVISTTLLGGRTMVHVVADSAPDESFQRVQPDLKDVYFTMMRGLPLHSAAPVALGVSSGTPAEGEARNEPAAPEPIAPHLPASPRPSVSADGEDPWATFRRPGAAPAAPEPADRAQGTGQGGAVDAPPPASPAHAQPVPLAAFPVAEPVEKVEQNPASAAPRMDGPGAGASTAGAGDVNPHDDIALDALSGTPATDPVVHRQDELRDSVDPASQAAAGDASSALHSPRPEDPPRRAEAERE